MPVPQGVHDLVRKKIARPNPKPPQLTVGRPVPSPVAKPVPNTMPKMPVTDPRIPPSTGIVPEGFSDDLRRLQGNAKSNMPFVKSPMPDGFKSNMPFVGAPQQGRSGSKSLIPKPKLGQKGPEAKPPFRVKP